MAKRRIEACELQEVKTPPSAENQPLVKSAAMAYPSLFSIDVSSKGSNPSDELFNYLYNHDEDGFRNSRNINQYKNSDNGNYTLLQFAADHGLIKVVKYLLDIGADPNLTIPNNSIPPLLLAARGGYHKIFGLFLEHKDIVIPPNTLAFILECMRFHERLFETIDEDVNYNLCYSLLMEYKDRSPGTVLDFMCSTGTGLYLAAVFGDYKRSLNLLRNGISMARVDGMHEALPVKHIDAPTLQTHLDECVEINLRDNVNREGFIAEYNYRTLIPSRRVKKESHCSGNAEVTNIWSDLDELESETEVIHYMSKSSELKHLLKHPVITSFLFMKWRTMRSFFYINLVFYLMFCLCLISFIVVTYTSTRTEYNYIDNTLLCFLHFSFVSLAVREVFQFVFTIKNYFSSFESLLEFLVLILTAIILFCGDTTDSFRKQVSAFAILIAASELIILIGSHPNISTYVVMLRTVSISFFKFFAWYSLCIAAFSLSFYILFKDSNSDASQQYFFTNPVITMFKSIVMLTGEFEVSNINLQAYPFASHVIFMLFVFFIAIILFNLLNGLAVSDLQNIRSNSELVGYIERVDHINRSENILVFVIKKSHRFLPRFLTWWLLERICLVPCTLKDSKLMVYPNKRARIISTDQKRTRTLKKNNSCLRYFKDVHLDKYTARRTVQLIKDRKKDLEQKKSENNTIEEIRNEQKNILKKLELLTESLRGVSIKGEF